MAIIHDTAKGFKPGKGFEMIMLLLCTIGEVLDDAVT